jgi:hypothetical protein
MPRVRRLHHALQILALFQLIGGPLVLTVLMLLVKSMTQQPVPLTELPDRLLQAVQIAQVMERGGLTQHEASACAAPGQLPLDRNRLPSPPNAPTKDSSSGLSKSGIVWFLLRLPPPPTVASLDAPLRVPWRQPGHGPDRAAPPSPPPRAA